MPALLNKMPEAISIPLTVYGLGFIISMCIAVLIKFLLVAIKHFSKDPSKAQD